MMIDGAPLMVPYKGTILIWNIFGALIEIKHFIGVLEIIFKFSHILIRD